MAGTEKLNSKFIVQNYGALLLLLLLIAYNVVFTPNFVSVNVLWSMLLQSFTVIIIGLGMTLVIASGGIDISVGSVMAVSASVLAFFLNMEAGIFIAVMFALLAAGLCGAFNGFLIAKLEIQPIIATLILLTGGRGIAQVINDGRVFSFFGHDIGRLNFIRFWDTIPIQVVVSVVFLIIFYIVLNHMSLGRYILAVGGNPKVSRLSGIPIFKTKFAVYVIVALLAGVAAIFEVSRIASADPNHIGRLIELDVIASVAVGGTIITGGSANIVGTFIGAIAIQLITITVNMQNLPFHSSLILTAFVIFLALWLQRGSEE